MSNKYKKILLKNNVKISMKDKIEQLKLLEILFNEIGIRCENNNFWIRFGNHLNHRITVNEIKSNNIINYTLWDNINMNTFDNPKINNSIMLKNMIDLYFINKIKSIY